MNPRSRSTRRSVLLSGARWATAFVAFPRVIQSPATAGEDRSGRALVGDDSIVALARTIVAGTRGEALDVAAKHLANGGGSDALLAAALLAGVHDVQPRHVGGKLHCVMCIGSLLDLTSGESADANHRFALYAIDDFKSSQELDRSEGDWWLPPRRTELPRSASTARAELIAALDAWDEERADRAIVGFCARASIAEVFDVLRPFGLRCSTNLGHKVIYATRLERALLDPRLGLKQAESVFRSLVHALLHRPDGDRTESHRRALDLVSRSVRAMEGGPATDPLRTFEIVRMLRGAKWQDMQDGVNEALESGTNAATLWDALRILAAELFARRNQDGPASGRDQLLPVHFVTTVNAFGRAHRAATDEPTRRVALLQSAAWLALQTEEIATIAPLTKEDIHLDEWVGPDCEPPTFSEAWPTRDERTAYYAFIREEDPVGTCRAEVIPALARGVEEHHQIKYAAAFLEEASLAAPQHSAILLAPATRYLPHSGDPLSESGRRIDDALARAGVIPR